MDKPKNTFILLLFLIPFKLLRIFFYKISFRSHEDIANKRHTGWSYAMHNLVLKIVPMMCPVASS